MTDATVVHEIGEEGFDRVAPILRAAIDAGDVFAAYDGMSPEQLRAYWFKPGTRVFEAKVGADTAGTAYLRPNQPGRGDHVANAGFAVGAAHRGKGVARDLCRFVLETARKQGYAAMQFNFVVSTNAPAVKLWEDFGFATIGVIPGGFRHPSRGDVDVYIMHRKIL